MLIPCGSFGGLTMTYLRRLLSTPFWWHVFTKSSKDGSMNWSAQYWRTFIWMTVLNRCNQWTRLWIERRFVCPIVKRWISIEAKCLCNRRQVLKAIPTWDRASSILDLHSNSGILPIEVTLGVQCNMDSGMFTFKMVPKDKALTRRGILSVTSSIYDPLGKVSPIILLTEKLLQDLCKQGLTWDEEKVGK